MTSAPAGVDCGVTCAALFAARNLDHVDRDAGRGFGVRGLVGRWVFGNGYVFTHVEREHPVTATFAIATATLTVARAGGGSGSVTSAPSGISCGATCSAVFNPGTSITLTATPVAGSVFSGWSGGGCSGTGTCSLTLNASTTVTATFFVAPHTLTVTPAGVGQRQRLVRAGGYRLWRDVFGVVRGRTGITLTAAADSSSVFAGWSGGGCSGTGPCSITLSAATSVHRDLRPLPPPSTLTVTLAGSGAGAVTSAPVRDRLRPHVRDAVRIRDQRHVDARPGLGFDVRGLVGRWMQRYRHVHGGAEREHDGHRDVRHRAARDADGHAGGRGFGQRFVRAGGDRLWCDVFGVVHARRRRSR